MVARILTTLALVLASAVCQAQTAGNYAVELTTTASPVKGLIYDREQQWIPGVTGNSQYNFYQFFDFSYVGLSNRTSNPADQWFSSNVLAGSRVRTSSGMANSHTLAHLDQIVIPPGLGDGQNGAPWNNDVPGNPNYQEGGIYEGSCLVLSPGHYCEGGAAYLYDNNGGTGAVPARLSGYVVQMVKDSPTNTYSTTAFEALSAGTQQGAYAPVAAFRADGGWQVGLDLYNQTSGIPVLLPGGWVITSDNSAMCIWHGSRALQCWSD